MDSSSTLVMVQTSTKMKLDADPKKPEVVVPLGPPPRKPNLPEVPPTPTPDTWTQPVNAD